MAVSANTRTILIESILGGHAPMSHFAAPDQFRASIGIDPSLPANDSNDATNIDGTAFVASGLLRPTSYVESFATAGHVRWIISPPDKRSGITDEYYVYDEAGSVYSILSSGEQGTVTGDLNDGGTAQGNGAAYYDNYVYFARDTTIARLGPLTTSPTLTDDYWSGTLGLTPLQEILTLFSGQTELATHFLHRHSDGRLYIADFVDGKGTIHYIKTTKTTVEGDTNDGTTYNALQVGYGLFPVAMESYGADLVIAFVESESSGSIAPRAKIAFWDTTSQNINKITWVEFPDSVITGMKNVNGVLHIVSGPLGTSFNSGFRVTRFVGGYSFEEVSYIESGDSCAPGALDGRGDRLIFGTRTVVPYLGGGGTGVGCVYSLGLSKRSVSSGLFNIVGSTNSNSVVTALALKSNSPLRNDLPIVGIKKVATNTGAILVPTTTAYNNSALSVWWSQVYRVGHPFKITKIRIPLAQTVSGAMQVNPTIFTDDGEGGKALDPISVDTFNGKRNAVYRPDGLTGEHNFWVELRWMGASLCTIGLPITIEYEPVDD